jgi:ABC-type transport system involved in multi-copper enzyme maturation permease subunit
VKRIRECWTHLADNNGENMIKNILKYIVLTAVKDWFFMALLIGLFAVFGISSLLGFTALNEEGAMQLVVFAGSTRLLLVCGITIFICFYIARSFENKEISFILSKSISREKFVFSYWLGFNLVSQMLLIPIVILILMFFGNVNIGGILQWFISMSFELAIMTGFSVAISLIIKSPVFSVLSTFGFYILSRMMGFFVNLMYVGSDSKMAGILVDISNGIFKGISSLVPRLDLFGQTTWLIYGGDPKLLLIVLLQGLIYVPLLFMIAFYDFKKKQF